MPTQVEIFIPLSDLPKEAQPSDPLLSLALPRAAQATGVPVRMISRVLLLRKSLDARKGFPLGFRLQVQLVKEGEEVQAVERLPDPPRIRRNVVVIGSGPAGTFAALRLCQAGAKVTLLEQGKEVQPRRHDLAKLTRGSLSPYSNYCFGEGGAGTFSDGKLYTRTKDRLAVSEVLQVLVEHGADPQIAIESRPHIGSNRLPKILMAMREDLIARGVTYHFEERATDLLFSAGQTRHLRGVLCASGREVLADDVVLAVGHSARELYQSLFLRGVPMVAKAFAIGARVEHPQPLIDQIQYGRAAGHPALPAAFYQVSTSAHERGVYSFCMCPGGWIVPSATEAGGICVNGMSLKRRDSPFANSALVVTVTPSDFADSSPLSGMHFQRRIEEAAFALGGGTFVAPAQRLADFVSGKPSTVALPTTYRPSVVPTDLASVFPQPITVALKEAILRFHRTLPGFLSEAAQLVGVETRTSAPVQIIRDPASLQSTGVLGLYPSGEGAGYAGGIVSAAIDGLRVADALISRASGS